MGYLPFCLLCLVLAWLLQVVWSDRFKQDRQADCLVSVDGTDFRIAQHGRKFYSHKFKKSGLRYEVAVCIQTGDIVWINGPYECGIWPDISIFRNSIISFLTKNERVEADDGYIGEAPKHVKCPRSFVNPVDTETMQSIARLQHETINKRFKNWKILAELFRHDIVDHGDVFRAVVVMTQASFNDGDRPFDVEYSDELEVIKATMSKKKKSVAV